MSQFSQRLEQEILNEIRNIPSISYGKIVKVDEDSVDIELVNGNPMAPSHYNKGEILKNVPCGFGKGMISVTPKLEDMVVCGFADKRQESAYIIRYGDDKNFTISSPIGTGEYVPDIDSEGQIEQKDTGPSQNQTIENKDKPRVSKGNYNGDWGPGTKGGGWNMIREESDISPIILSTYKNNVHWPSPGVTRVTCPFGLRNSNGGKISQFHHGVDIGTYNGNKIVSVAAGKIHKIGSSGVYGNYVVVSHAHNFYTRYAHLSKTLVIQGQTVEAGTHIADSGSSGTSAPHLHFETMEGADQKFLDPAIFISSS